MTPALMTLLFATTLVGGLLLQLFLASRQIRHVAKHRSAVPADYASKISLQAHQKAADYTVTKTRFGILELAIGAVLLIGWTLLGGIDWLNQSLLSKIGSGLPQQLALLVAFALIGALIDLPFSLYSTFIIEEKFGFNKITWKLWLTDAIKGIAIGVALGLPIIALILWLMAKSGSLWWLWAWLVWTAFGLFIQWIFPTFLAPIFNKFEPLSDETVKERVTNLMKRCGFTAKGLYVMDGSKRSAHSNAYFTGFGSSKRVVFYDTLLKSLSPGELDAVLAHELGHFKHKHILKGMLSMMAMSLAGFALLGFLSQQAWFYLGLGVRPITSDVAGVNSALALLLFMLTMPLLTAFISPLFAQISRKHEFEADAYAVQQAQGADLKSALLKMYEENASSLTPDPLYVKFYFSHPPATERFARLGV